MYYTHVIAVSSRLLPLPNCVKVDELNLACAQLKRRHLVQMCASVGLLCMPNYAPAV